MGPSRLLAPRLAGPGPTGASLELLVGDRRALEADLTEVTLTLATNAAEAGVSRMVVPATTANRWEKIRLLCARHDGLYPAYGLHPWFVEQHQLIHLRELDEWLARERPVALGECGLDFYQSRRDEDWQKRLFVEQLQLAANHGLPVIVHSRKANDDVIGLLRRHARHGGVVHSFGGSLQHAQRLFDLGFKLGIAATV